MNEPYPIVEKSGAGHTILNIGFLPVIDTNLDCQIFKVIGENISHPYRVRLIDRTTREVGPQVRCFKTLAKAARLFERKEITW